MMRKRLFYDKVTFTSDTDDITVIQPRYIEEIHVSLDVTQTGATSPSLSDILSVLDTAQVKLTGRIITELSGRDILAYNCLVRNRSVKYTVPTADTELGRVEGLAIPLQLAPGDHVLSVRFLHGSVSTITSEKLSFSTLENDDARTRTHVEMPNFSFTPPSTAAYNTALDVSFAGLVTGFLIYSPTIPTTSSDTATVKKVRLKVGGDIVYEDNWNNLAAQTFYPEDSTLRALLDNYIYLDMSDGPVEAGNRIEVEIYSDDTNTVKIIPIVRV